MKLNLKKNNYSNVNIFVLFLFLTLSSCKKENNNNTETQDFETQVAVNIKGIEDESENIISLAKINNSQILENINQPYNESSEEDVQIGGDKYIITSSLERDNFSTVENNILLKNILQASINNPSINFKNRIAATSLGVNKKYRILLYDQENPNAAPLSVLGTAGTQLKIPVRRGKTYKWVAISNNDLNDPLTTYTNTITTSQKDLIYANGTVAIPNPSNTTGVLSVPIDITLRHLLSRVRVQIDVTALPSPITINAASISLDNTNYFVNGVVDIKTGTINSTVPYATSNPITTLTDPIAPNIGVKYIDFYTARFAAINPFEITVNSLNITTNGSNKSLSTAKSFKFTTLTTAQGKSNTAIIKFSGSGTIDCNSVSFSSGNAPIQGTAIPTTPALTYKVNYTNAIASSFSAYETPIGSEVNGLKAKVTAGNLENGSGSFNVTISGTPSASAPRIVYIPIKVAGMDCTIPVSVLPSSNTATACGISDQFGRNINLSASNDTTTWTKLTLADNTKVGVKITASGGYSGSSLCLMNSAAFPNQPSNTTAYCGMAQDLSSLMRIGNNNSGSFGEISPCNNKKIIFEFSKPVNDVTVIAAMFHIYGYNGVLGPDQLRITASGYKDPVDAALITPVAYNEGDCSILSQLNKITNVSSFLITSTSIAANANSIVTKIRANRPYTILTVETPVTTGDDIIMTLGECQAVSYGSK